MKTKTVTELWQNCRACKKATCQTCGQFKQAVNYIEDWGNIMCTAQMQSKHMS